MIYFMKKVSSDVCCFQHLTEGVTGQVPYSILIVSEPAFTERIVPLTSDLVCAKLAGGV